MGRISKVRVTGVYDTSLLVRLDCVHKGRVQVRRHRVIAVVDQMVSTDRTDVACEVIIHSVIDGVFHVSDHDDMVCTTFVGVCGVIREKEKYVAYCVNR